MESPERKTPFRIEKLERPPAPSRVTSSEPRRPPEPPGRPDGAATPTPGPGEGPVRYGAGGEGGVSPSVPPDIHLSTGGPAGSLRSSPPDTYFDTEDYTWGDEEVVYGPEADVCGWCHALWRLHLAGQLLERGELAAASRRVVDLVDWLTGERRSWSRDWHFVLWQIEPSLWNVVDLFPAEWDERGPAYPVSQGKVPEQVVGPIRNALGELEGQIRSSPARGDEVREMFDAWREGCAHRA